MSSNSFECLYSVYVGCRLDKVLLQEITSLTISLLTFTDLSIPPVFDCLLYIGSVRRKA